MSDSQPPKACQSLPGSPIPEDIFEPHMPGVEVFADMDDFFAKARQCSLFEPLHAVVIVTPGRHLIPLPAPQSRSLQAEHYARSILRTSQPLSISAVAYNKLEALVPHQGAGFTEMSRCIPFLGLLISFAGIGNNVLVFEGHPSAFEAGVRGMDLLIIDSAMLPFLQEDWALVAFAVMKPKARVFVFNRERHSLLPAALAKNKSGWRYPEHDGEANYAKCLLTAIAIAQKREAVRISSGSPLPDLSQIAIDPAEWDWVSRLPFKYDKLDAEEVIEIMVGSARPAFLGLLAGSLTLKVPLKLSEGKTREVSFRLREFLTRDLRRHLDIELR